MPIFLNSMSSSKCVASQLVLTNSLFTADVDIIFFITNRDVDRIFFIMNRDVDMSKTVCTGARLILLHQGVTKCNCDWLICHGS